MAFIFQFVNMVYHIDWFANIEGFLHLWDKAHLVMMYNLFDMLLYARILLRMFASVFISDIDLQFSFFLWHICPVLASRWQWPCRMSLGVFLPLEFFWRSLSKIGVSYFLKFLVEFTSEEIWSWAFVCWKIFYCSFSLYAWNWSVQNLYFFLIQFWKVILF